MKYSTNQMIDYIHEHAEGAVILSDLNDAIIGVVEEFSYGPKIMYSREKILNILVERDGMTEMEALEYYDFNILGLFAGDQSPVFMVKNLNND